MRTYPVLLLIGVSLFLVAACVSQPESVPAEYRVTSTIKDIMDSMVDPSADFLWEDRKSVV